MMLRVRPLARPTAREADGCPMRRRALRRDRLAVRDLLQAAQTPPLETRCLGGRAAGRTRCARRRSTAELLGRLGEQLVVFTRARSPSVASSGRYARPCTGRSARRRRSPGSAARSGCRSRCIVGRAAAGAASRSSKFLLVFHLGHRRSNTKPRRSEIPAWFQAGSRLMAWSPVAHRYCTAYARQGRHGRGAAGQRGGGDGRPSSRRRPDAEVGGGNASGSPSARIAIVSTVHGPSPAARPAGRGPAASRCRGPGRVAGGEPGAGRRTPRAPRHGQRSGRPASARGGEQVGEAAAGSATVSPWAATSRAAGCARPRWRPAARTRRGRRTPAASTVRGTRRPGFLRTSGASTGSPPSSSSTATGSASRSSSRRHG